MTAKKLVKFWVEPEYHAAVSQAAARIHGTPPQLFKLAMDAYLRQMGLQVEQPHG